jgi:hypothetical protein
MSDDAPMTADDDLADLLAAAPPEVGAIALHARDLIRTRLPGTIEMVDRPAKLIGYGRDRSYRGLICGLVLQSAWVNLMFSRGTDLDDPDSLLEGTGKRARHVKLRSVEHVERPEVAALIIAAGELTPSTPPR